MVSAVFGCDLSPASPGTDESWAQAQSDEAGYCLGAAIFSLVMCFLFIVLWPYTRSLGLLLCQLPRIFMALLAIAWELTFLPDVRRCSIFLCPDSTTKVQGWAKPGWVGCGQMTAHKWMVWIMQRGYTGISAKGRGVEAQMIPGEKTRQVCSTCCDGDAGAS